MMRTAQRSGVRFTFPMRLLLAFSLLFGGLPALGQTDEDLLTVAERSGFTSTARHDDVVALLDRLAERFPLARRAVLGQTVEGRSIPLLIVSDPPVSTAAEAASQVKDGKLIALLLGNIHAGEVDGKEGLPILAREVLTTPGHPLLKDFVLVFAPSFNADGNERVAKSNRPGQNGPENGMGIRENAAGLDLNRDFVKLESPEARALVRFLNEWDPHVFIDTHTTNGSHHRYVLTYEGPRNPAGYAPLTEYFRDEMMPRVEAALRENDGREVFVYGDFTPDHAAWETFPAQARFVTNYVGLRNRLAILSEGYSYAPYKERVLATRDFVRACLSDIAAHKGEVRKLLKAADEATGARVGAEGSKEPAAIALRSKAVPAPEKATIKGFVEEKREGKAVSTGEPRDYECELRTRFEPTMTVTKPAAYIVPRGATAAIETLQRHGIEVEELREDIELPVEEYTVRSIARAKMEFQKHWLLTIGVESAATNWRVEAGAAVVRTDQKLGHLAAYLLEPGGDDGLAAWNFFDESLKEGGLFPVVRVPREVALTTTAWRPLPEDRRSDLPITFETMYEAKDPPRFGGSPVGGLSWLDDGEHFLQWKAGTLRKVHAVTGASEVFATTDGRMTEALAALPAIGKKAAGDLASRAWGNTSPDRVGAYFNHENDLYYATFDGAKACRLTSTPEPEELVSFSPDGRFVSFVRGNDLYVVDVDSQTERRLTTDGAEHVLNGKADWVYFEELFGRNWKVYWWSPDSRRLAFYRTDNSMVPRFTIVDELGAPQEVETTLYPRPGEPNPRVKLGMVSVAGGAPVFADLSGYEVDGHLLANAGWFPDSSSAWVYVTNRIQSWLDVCRVAPSGSVTRLFRETTGAWVDTPPALTFLGDGSFLFTSERSGYKHLYRYAADGSLNGAVTSGEWECRGVELVHEKSGSIFVNATKDSPIATNLYRVDLASGEMERLTTAPGSHRAELNPSATMFIDSWSSRQAPAQVALRRAVADAGGPAGSIIRVLDTNPVHALEEYRFGERAQFQVAMKDGFLIEAAWTKPPNFDPARKYPVWFMTYAGPQAPTISDSWGDGGVYDQVLASAGFVVFRADPRAASGKGAVSAWPSYRQLGAPELADIVETITWLKEANPWIDGSRIGMSGFSFGGYITAYAMTHSDVFAAGIAGGSPTDWREYDTIYTERYMSTPQDNPEGYDKTSVIKAAKDLKGRLMLMHGLGDDNVHAANSWKLARAFQQAGVQFEMMMYPGFRHGIGGKHYRRFMYDWKVRVLRPEETVYGTGPEPATGP